MSEKKKVNETREKATEMVNKTSEVAKNIWLAGLGAYGKAFDEAQEAYDRVSEKMTGESTKVFDELVEKGRKLEIETQKSATEAREKAQTSIEERISKVREALSFEGLHFNRGSDLSELNQKIDALTKKVDAISKAVNPKEPSKPRAVKKAASSE